MAACGAFHVAAVTEDGELFTWGRGMDAQLATGGLANELLPRRIGLLGGFRVVAAAAGHSHTAAVTEDGALWTWGDSEHGQLGHGEVLAPTQLCLAPARVETLKLAGASVRAIACGRHHCIVVATYGLVWTWGQGQHGTLGLGDKADRRTPVCLGNTRLPAKIVSVAAGATFSIALSDTGSIWTWGTSQRGCLGLESTAASLIPAEVPPSSFDGPVTNVSAGLAHSLAVTALMTMWAWGDGTYGRLGLGDNFDRWRPSQVGAGTEFAAVEIKQVVCGFAHSLALTLHGDLYSWGRGAQGRLGHSDNLDLFVPKRIHLSRPPGVLPLSMTAQTHAYLYQ